KRPAHRDRAPREADMLVAVNEESVLDMQADRPGEDRPLDVAADGLELGYVVAVVDAGDVLFDDGPGVQLLGDVVRRGADDLHAPLVGLLVRPPAYERRHERMVDVDDPVGVVLAEVP